MRYVIVLFLLIGSVVTDVFAQQDTLVVNDSLKIKDTIRIAPDANTGATEMAPRKPATDYLIIISTRFGDMKLLLFDDTPLHKANFIKKAQAGVFDGSLFHRVIDHFVIQGGNPYSKIGEEPEQRIKEMCYYKVPDECLPHHKHEFGSIAMARQGNDRNPEKKSSSNQFYIVENRAGLPHIDGKYTVFGKVMSGFEVIEKICSLKTTDKDKPLTNVAMTVSVVKVLRSDVETFYSYNYPEL